MDPTSQNIKQIPPISEEERDKLRKNAGLIQHVGLKPYTEVLTLPSATHNYADMDEYGRFRVRPSVARRRAGVPGDIHAV